MWTTRNNARGRQLQWRTTARSTERGHPTSIAQRHSARKAGNGEVSDTNARTQGGRRTSSGGVDGGVDRRRQSPDDVPRICESECALAARMCFGLLCTRFGKSRHAGAVHKGRRLLPISTSEDTGMARRRTTRTGAGSRARMQRHDATTCGGHLVVLAARKKGIGGRDLTLRRRQTTRRAGRADDEPVCGCWTRARRGICAGKPRCCARTQPRASHAGGPQAVARRLSTGHHAG